MKKIKMTVSRSKGFVYSDKTQNVSKKQVLIFGSIIATGCLSGAFLIAMYIEYLHNPAFHSFVQSRGIFLWTFSSLILDIPCTIKKALFSRAFFIVNWKFFGTSEPKYLVK